MKNAISHRNLDEILSGFREHVPKCLNSLKIPEILQNFDEKSVKFPKLVKNSIEKFNISILSLEAPPGLPSGRHRPLAWPRGPRVLNTVPSLTPILQPNDQILEGSFSSVSTPPIARVGAFFQDFQDLQDLHAFAPLRFQNSNKISLSFFAFFPRNLASFA